MVIKSPFSSPVPIISSLSILSHRQKILLVPEHHQHLSLKFHSKMISSCKILLISQGSYLFGLSQMNSSPTIPWQNFSSGRCSKNTEVPTTCIVKTALRISVFQDQNKDLFYGTNARNLSCWRLSLTLVNGPQCEKHQSSSLYESPSSLEARADATQGSFLTDSLCS